MAKKYGMLDYPEKMREMDAKMISEDKNATAFLPQKVIMKNYASVETGMGQYSTGDKREIDSQISADLAAMRRGMKKK